MGLQSPVVVLVEVLDIEPATAAAAAAVVAAAERPVARGAEEVEEEEHRHRRRRHLGALLLKSQETQDHKSAAAWSTYVLRFCFQPWLFVVLLLFS